MAKKIRLDLLMQQQYPHYSRTQIQSWIMQGKVTIEGVIVNKAGTQVDEQAVLTVMIDEPKYVSRAGYKLEKALEHFALDVTGLICLDAGLSTGGFTDCLLQHGAAKVYGIDVGHGQVHEKIRHDPRVIVQEKTNLRSVRSVGELVDLITLDVSFISVLKLMDAVNALLKSHGLLIVLIKPQFEAQRHEVGAGGIIKNPAIHKAVVDVVVKGIEAHGFSNEGVIESPIKGVEGNKEFLAFFKKKE